MGLPVDFEGTEPEKPIRGDGGIIGPAGQKVGAGKKPRSEQIAAWGGLGDSESETNETERPVTMPIPRDYDKPGRGPS